MTAQKTGRLQLVECARGLAAFSVVLFHANASSQLEGWTSHSWFTIFQYGVDFFFVLSGYIIFFAHRRDFGQPTELRRYLTKRAIRLLPILWLVTIVVFSLRTAASLPVDFSQFLRSAIPYPSLLPTAPAVIWTLRHEFIFYLAIALVIYSFSLGRAVMVLWFSACVLQLFLMLLGKPITGLASFFLSSYSLDFAIGMLVGRMHENRTFKSASIPLATGFAMLATALWLDLGSDFHRLGPTDYVTTKAGWFTLVLGVSFGMILHGLLVLEDRVRAPKSLVLLGGATYALYLIHTPVNGLTLLAIRNLGMSDELAQGAGAVLLVFLGTLAGILLHLLFEQPVGKYLRNRFAGARRLEPSGHPEEVTIR